MSEVSDILKGLTLRLQRDLKPWTLGELVPVPHRTMMGFPSRSLDVGNSGFLMTLLRSSPLTDQTISQAAAGAELLLQVPVDKEFPGLCQGESGAALVSLLVAESVSNPTLRATSLDRLDVPLNVRAAHGQIDFYSGTAGQLRASLAAYLITGEASFRQQAETLAGELSTRWTITSDCGRHRPERARRAPGYLATHTARQECWIVSLMRSKSHRIATSAQLVSTWQTLWTLHFIGLARRRVWTMLWSVNQ